MKKRLIVIALMGTTLLLSACGNDKLEVLKSPCVGLAGSPCGPKRPVNGVLNPNFDPNAAGAERDQS